MFGSKSIKQAFYAQRLAERFGPTSRAATSALNAAAFEKWTDADRPVEAVRVVLAVLNNPLVSGIEITVS